MSIRDRLVDGDTRRGQMRIRSGNFDLIVEARELYTSYRIIRLFNHRHSYYSQDSILYHDVRTPDPVPMRPAHIIHARRIPWFMSVYYLVKDLLDRRRWKRETAHHQEKERVRINAIRALAEKHMSSRFKGRYN
jgi:hypothetical protein